MFPTLLQIFPPTVGLLFYHQRKTMTRVRKLFFCTDCVWVYINFRTDLHYKFREKRNFALFVSGLGGNRYRYFAPELLLLARADKLNMLIRLVCFYEGSNVAPARKSDFCGSFDQSTMTMCHSLENLCPCNWTGLPRKYYNTPRKTRF